MLGKPYETDPSHDPPKEGEFYKEVDVGGRRFCLLYGYYEESDRNSSYGEPIPIYPDFVREPVYTKEGAPIVTAMQDVCELYRGKDEPDGCSDCRFFRKEEELFGICSAPENQREVPATEPIKTAPQEDRKTKKRLEEVR